MLGRFEKKKNVCCRSLLVHNRDAFWKECVWLFIHRILGVVTDGSEFTETVPVNLKINQRPNDEHWNIRVFLKGNRNIQRDDSSMDLLRVRRRRRISIIVRRLYLR